LSRQKYDNALLVGGFLFEGRNAVVIKRSLVGAVVLIGVCMVLSSPVPSFAIIELVSLSSGLRFVGDVRSRDDQYLVLQKDHVKYQIALSEISSTEPVSGTLGEMSAMETQQEWLQIIEVMRNYFLHRYDADLKAAMSSISKEFLNETMIPGESMDYQGLERFLKKRNLKMRGQLLDSLDISAVTIENNTLAITISFKEQFEDLVKQTGSVEQREKIIILSQEDRGWKIINILGPSAQE
jgi:hypothetical protein